MTYGSVGNKPQKTGAANTHVDVGDAGRYLWGKGYIDFQGHPIVRMGKKKEKLPVPAVLQSPNAGKCSLAGLSGSYLVKAATGAAKAAEGAELGSKIADGTGTAGIEVTSVFALVANWVKRRQNREKSRRTLKEAALLYRKAKAYDDGDHSAKNAAAYLDFKSRMRNFVAAPLPAGRERKRRVSRSDVALEDAALTATLPRYALNASSATASLVAIPLSASAYVAPATALVAPAIAAAECIQAHNTLKLGRRQTAVLDHKRQALNDWQAAHEEQGLNLPVGPIHRACSRRLDRQRRLANWTKRGAKVQFAKAGLNGALGVTGGVMLSLAAAGAVVAGVMTAGIAVVAVGSLVSAAYLAYAVTRVFRKARTERHAAREQRQAEALIKSCDERELRRLMQSKSTLTRTRELVTLETRGRIGKRKKTEVKRLVDVGANSHVALHLMARELARKPNSREGAAVEDLLARSGMTADEVKALRLSASEMAMEDRVRYLHKEIAVQLGVPFKG